MPGKWRPGVIGRGAGRRRGGRLVRTRPAPQPISFDRLLDVRIVDQLLERLLRRPRTLQVAVFLIGLLLIALELYPLLWAAPATSTAVRTITSAVNTSVTTPTPPGASVEQEAL